MAEDEASALLAEYFWEDVDAAVPFDFDSEKHEL